MRHDNDAKIRRPDLDLSYVYYEYSRQDDGPWATAVFLDPGHNKIITIRVVDGAFYYGSTLGFVLRNVLNPFGAGVTEWVHEGNVTPLRNSKSFVVTLNGQTALVIDDHTIMQQIFTVLRDLGVKVERTPWGEDTDEQITRPDGSVRYDFAMPETEWEPPEKDYRSATFSLQYTWHEDETAEIREPLVPLNSQSKEDAIQEAEALYATRKSERGPDGLVIWRSDGGCVYTFDPKRQKPPVAGARKRHYSS
jgi:hypothetical protein